MKGWKLPFGGWDALLACADNRDHPLGFGLFESELLAWLRGQNESISATSLRNQDLARHSTASPLRRCAARLLHPTPLSNFVNHCFCKSPILDPVLSNV